MSKKPERKLYKVGIFAAAFCCYLYYRGHYAHSDAYSEDKLFLATKLPPAISNYTAASGIPRKIHQILGIYGDWTCPQFKNIKDVDIPFASPEVKDSMQSWQDMNPSWEYILWDRKKLEEVITQTYPQYWKCWNMLPKDVERADFARYLVLYHSGGVYADADVKALKSMDEVILPGDGLIATWEDMYPSPADAFARGFVRQAQITNWWFASSAGHPTLRHLLDKIASHSRVRFYNDSERDTLLRTGPGVFTDTILLGVEDRISRKSEQEPIRVLPRISGGFYEQGVAITDGPIIMHLFTGTWRSQEVDLPSNITARFNDYQIQALRQHLFPTSVLMHPPFTVMHHARGQGDMYDGADTSYQLNMYGIWQPNNVMGFKPAMLESFFEGLAGPGLQKASFQEGSTPLFIDVGAGYGVYSLAAASRGVKVVAFELAAKSHEALQASASFNRFPIHLVQSALGAKGENICLEPQLKTVSLEGLSRGYGPPALHRYMKGCKSLTERRPALEAVLEEIPEGANVTALRVSANTWGVRILQALLPLAEHHHIHTIQLEWHPNESIPDFDDVSPATKRAELLQVLQRLLQLGFTNIHHTGRVCEQRWEKHRREVLVDYRDWALTQSISAKTDARSLEHSLCRLVSEHFGDLLPEVLTGERGEVFIFKRPYQATDQVSP